MKRQTKLLLILILISILLMTLSTESFAWDKNQTFEAFYTKGLGWTSTVIVAAIAAIAVALLIFFTGGTASPIVVTIGTWVGNAAGLTGIAATNYGLALLGGGSLASGGFGILGGTVVLTAALSFTTDIVVDYTLETAFEKYDKAQFIAQAENLPVIPFPRSNTGSDLYEQVMDLINENYNSKLPHFSEENRNVIKASINIASNNPSLDEEELPQIYTLLSLLYFYSSDYIKSQDYAKLAIEATMKLNRQYTNSLFKGELKYTLPQAIWAITSLAEEHPPIPKSLDTLYYATINESKNDLIPFVLSLFIQRLMLRQDVIEPDHFDILLSIINECDAKYKTQTAQVLLIQSILMLKKEQDFISNVYSNPPQDVSKQDTAYILIQASRKHYLGYIKVANSCVELIKHDRDFMEKYDNSKQLINIVGALAKYEYDIDRLSNMVNDFRKNKLRDDTTISPVIFIFVLLSIVLTIMLVVYRKKVTRKEP